MLLRQAEIALTAALSAMPAQVPEGWKLVPAKIDLEMCVAFAETFYDKRRCMEGTDDESQDWYAAMLAAAPSPPAAQEG